METPASMRMVTRSQSAALLKKSKMQEEVEAKRQPLFDITNDSPITSLIAKETPTKHNASSTKSGGTDKKTPFSGESLMRCQVKTLLQNIEGKKDGIHMANTVIQALVFDTPDISEVTDISSNDSSLAIITAEDPDTVSSSDDDCSSLWSLQVNGSSEKDDLDEEIKGETEESEELYLYQDHEEEEEDEEFLYLCKEMNGMRVGEETEIRNNVNMPEFRGKHTKFVYNSEDEIEDQVMVLQGLPAPEGTRARFSYEDDE